MLEQHTAKSAEWSKNKLLIKVLEMFTERFFSNIAPS